MGVEIIGVGSYQPGEPIGNAKIEELVGPLPEDILADLAVTQRYWLIDPDTGQHSESNSEMATKASVSALESCNIGPESVDLMICATGTPDYTLPAVVNQVQEALGIERCATFELRSGGAGVPQALDLARLMMEDGDDYQTALIIGSEAVSPVLCPVYLTQPREKIRMRDRLPVYMFSDGAGAIVLKKGEPGSPGLRSGTMKAIGGTRKPGIHAIGGGTKTSLIEQQKKPRLVDLRVDVVGAGEFTPHMVTEAIAETLRSSGKTALELDWCLIPEGNVGWLLKSMEESGTMSPEWKALKGKIFDDLAHTGACGCAAVPLFLDNAWRSGMFRVGDEVALIGVEATKWIYAGLVVDWSLEGPVS